MSAWHWPQHVAAFALALRLVVHIAKDGQPRDGGKYSAGGALFVVAAWFFILWHGGFWDGRP